MAEGASKEAALPAWWRQIVSSQRREAHRLLAELLATRGIMPLGFSEQPTALAQAVIKKT